MKEANQVNYAEHIANLQATRAEKAALMAGIHQKSMDESRSMDTGEAEQFETLEGEIKALDSDIARTGRLKAIQDVEKSTATVVDDTAKRKAVASTGVQTVGVSTVEKLEPGIAFARYAMCLMSSKGNKTEAFQLAKQYFPKTEAVVQVLKAQSEGMNLQRVMKAVVAAGTTTDATWAGPLVYANTFAGDFLEYLRPRTLIGQANFRRVPFNVRINGQTSGGTAGWVGQGKAKPVTKFDYNATTIPFTKVAAITVLTQELARFSDPSAQALIRDSLADTVIARIDSDLFDPDVAAVANVSPAGLLNGVSPVAGPPATGVDASEIRCALLRLWAPWDSTNIGARPAYYTTPAVARNLAFMRDPLGNLSFPGVTPNGGTLDGIPLRVSNYLANNGGSGGAPLILVDESEVWLADDGNVTLDASEQASLQMDDAPTNSSSPTVAATSLVSMWQTDSIALRAERFIWWGMRRSGAIQWIDGFPSSC